MSRIWFIGLLIAGIASTGLASVFQPQSFEVERTGSGVVVMWSTAAENGISQFEVYRKAANASTWDMVFVLGPKGAGYQYRWIDETAFKTTDNYYQYFVRAVFSDGRQPEDTPTSGTTSPNTSGVRRTWGSIKAMFR